MLLSSQNILWIVQVSAGTGPPEVRAFVGHLAAWLEGECATRGLGVTDVVTVGVPPASVAIYVTGPAPAVLADVLGTHALMARNPERGRRARKRWFAGVSIHPRAEAPVPAAAATLNLADIAITAARAGGPGGQHVNRTASAVRAVHRPTGIAVRVTQERSQHANRKRALARLAHLLAARDRTARDRRRTLRRRAHYQVTRGNPVMTWRLDQGAGRRVALIRDEQ
jgi:peptide chain release factor 2/peptide chain release factor